MMATDEFDPPAADSLVEDEAITKLGITEIRNSDAPDDDASESVAEDVPDANPNKREARYRLQLRETEVERDQLLSTVEALQRAEVERIAGASIQKPSALWSTDIELSALLDDAGRVDPIKVADAVKDATNVLGLASKRPAGYVGGEGRVVGQPAAANPWEAAFKG